MEPLLQSLNPAQKEAALCIDQHVRIVAGAGSGKTRVLMARIEYLLNEVGVWPDRILAITFTNKAAREMKDRLEAQVGADAHRVRISTIHSLCVRILREDAGELGFPKDFTILDGEDQKSVLRRIYKNLGLGLKEYPFGATLSMISGWKTAGYHPQTVMAQAVTKDMKAMAQVYQEYVKSLQGMYAMDFDDLLINGERLLRLHDDVREKWQNRLDYIHVDEFQDVDPIQYSLIRHLVREDAVLAVVGDPDQTIYTWRGANVEIIMHFDQDFSPSRTIILSENYRSTPEILQGANGLISSNRNRIHKDLISTQKTGRPIVLENAPDEETEARIVAGYMKHLHQEGTPWKDMAVLYRSNYMSRNFEKVLRLMSVPYRIYGGIRFYERQEIKDMLCYLKLLTRPDENDPKQMSLNLAVERVANVPKRAMGPKFFEQLHAEAAARDVNLLEVMKDPQTMPAASAKEAKKFAQLIDDLRHDLETDGLSRIVDHILFRTGYESMLRENREEARLENVLELKNDIEQNLKEDPDLNLESYLQEVALFTDRTEEDREDAVTLMTVHAAKGTEFDTVFVAGVNEGVFPSARAMQESGNAGLEEERRLMYVAMTRAKRRLYVTWNQGYSYQSGSAKTLSRFVTEIPAEYTSRNQKSSAAAKKTKPSLSLNEQRQKNRRSQTMRPGTIVDHKTYGEGVVVAVSGEIITVVFSKIGAQKKIRQDYLEVKNG